MLTVKDFLDLPNELKAVIIADKMLGESIGYPSWEITGKIIEHLNLLGFNTQSGSSSQMANVSIFSYLEDESFLRGQVFIHQQSDISEPQLESFYRSFNPYHDAIAVAALMACGVIDTTGIDGCV